MILIKKVQKYQLYHQVKLISISILLVQKYCQKQITEQAKFTYFPQGRAFEKQTKTMKGQGKKQDDILKTLKP